MDLMVVQRRLGFFEASYERSRLACLQTSKQPDRQVKVARLGIGSLPSPFEPASLFLSVNGLRRKPIFCRSWTSSMTGFSEE